MLFRTTALRRVASALTASTETHEPTTKGMHATRQTSQRLLRERLRRRRAARTRAIFAEEEGLKTTVATATDARDVVMAQLADQIFSRGHRYIGCATNVGFVPDGNPAMPLVALAGRERVGKTSLLRSLFRDAQEVSRANRQLRRDAMNFFNVGDVFNVVDLPGFGGTSVPWSTVLQHAVLLRNFARCQPSLKMLYYCMDVHYKHGVYVQDLDLLRFLAKEVPNFTIVLTKAEALRDEPHAPQHLLRLEDVRKELMLQDIHHPVLVTSAFRMGGLDTLRFDMVMNSLHALPTERLTLTEARRLSERLLTQSELGTVRQLPLTPTELDDELREWQAEIAGERTATDVAALPGGTGRPPVKDEAADEAPHEDDDIFHVSPADVAAALVTPAALGINDSEASQVQPPLLQQHDSATVVAVPRYFADPLRQAAYGRLCKKVTNKSLMQYVHRTSPWRNPLLWPAHVVPTRHLKSNLMRCPEDPFNPYLSQPSFVAPRADLYFRRPNVGARSCARKGRYEADKPLAILLKPYTVPYFPDIVDVDMHPQPWTFLGSREAYYERDGGRQLGVRLSHYVTEGQLNPLLDNPAPDNTALTHELRTLEARRYGLPIAMLRPPDTAAPVASPSPTLPSSS